jgi:ABC-2 type transport system ATP-binding protein
MEEGKQPIFCEGLRFAYKGKPLVNCDINLTIGRAELFCLLGPNGAGKTTLIRQITGELIPLSGTVRVFGQNPARSLSQTKLSMGVIPQSVSLFENLSISRHLTSFAAIKGIKRRERISAIEAVVESCGIGELLERPARALSGGQQRSVLVALAMLGDPPILILDEPTVGLDPVSRRSIWQAIERQREAGKAVLLTTHHLEEAERLATHVGFISDGKLQHQGAKAELLSLLQFPIKITFAADLGGTRKTLYAKSHEEAQEMVSALGTDYAVAKTTMEDVYFQLAGGVL